MEQPKYLLENGVRVKTHGKLRDVKGMLISHENLSRRSSNTEGTICGVVGGHGGDVYWVEQRNGTAAYCFDEFELT